MIPRLRFSYVCAVLFLLGLLALPLRGSAAQDVSGLRADTAAVAGAVPGLRAARLVGERPRIDGRLDDGVWADAPMSDGFVQREPTPGAPATERTEVRVLYDDDAIYVGFRCWVRDPATLVSRLARRDQFVVSDRVRVELASTGDGRTAFSFGVSAAGVKEDLLLYDDVEEDDAWDAVWSGVAGRFAGGWSAEFRIPFSQLRYRPGQGVQAWTVQFQRDIPANGETAFWSPILPDREGYVSRFGRLDGLEGLAAPRRIEVLPYVAGRVTREPGDADDPFYSETAVGPNAGFDARIGLSTGLTLTATVNPDFGQVEADPANVNLTVFEAFFEERRPFFVEGTDVFRFGATRSSLSYARPTFFYSRRIGRAPQQFDAVYPDTSYAFVETPEQTTIAAAAKMSGQVGRWSVGPLAATTTPETARFYTPLGELRSARVEPWAGYTVARARRSWRGGQTVAGGFGSLAVRDAHSNAFGALLPGEAVVAGLDAEHAWGGRAWTASGVLAGSYVGGDAASIALLQRSSRRYYQRPDQTRLTFDPDATGLTGLRAEASVARTGGDAHWRGSLTGELTTPGFELNDLGFQTRADVAALSMVVGYTEAQPRRLRRWQLLGAAALASNLGGDVIYHQYDLTGRIVLPNLWTLQTTLAARPTVVNDRLTRGGPLALRPADAVWSARASTNGAAAVSASTLVQYRSEFAAHGSVRPERTFAFSGTLTYRPSSAVEFQLIPEWFNRFDTDQYVTGRTDALAAATYGRRYVFADVRQQDLFLGARADWTFSPDLSLQLYLAPAVTSARFQDYKELAAARTYSFTVYGVDRGTATPDASGGTTIDPGDGGAPFGVPDLSFTYLSLRGNAVVRWEYRPGSTLYAVWQQTRDSYGTFDGLDVLNDTGDVFDAPVRNVFLLKLSYWFGL